MRSFRPYLRPGLLSAGALLLGAPAGAQSDVLLQLESGSPASDRFVVDSAGGFVALGTFDRGTIPGTGAGTRLMWYPRKAAFRVGYVNGSQWADASIGDFSIATGANPTASGYASTAMGVNTAASGHASTATGAGTTASGSYSTAMGVGTRASGDFSTAMGRRASTQGFSGSFVYGDAATTDTVRASAAHQATWRTIGGFRIFTNTALSTGCSIVAGGTAWTCTSSRLEKENFAEVDGEDVLRRLRAVPVTSWNGIAEGPGVRHIGPMAQDWHAAFALNDDPLTIHQGDLAGATLAAVQALLSRTDALREENAALRAAHLAAEGRTEGQEERIRAVAAENAALHAEAAALRARLARLEALVGGLAVRP
jgi:trimeric autotransporter adhesin